MRFAGAGSRTRRLSHEKNRLELGKIFIFIQSLDVLYCNSSFVYIFTAENEQLIDMEKRIVEPQ